MISARFKAATRLQILISGRYFMMSEMTKTTGKRDRDQEEDQGQHERKRCNSEVVVRGCGEFIEFRKRLAHGDPVRARYAIGLVDQDDTGTFCDFNHDTMHVRVHWDTLGAAVWVFWEAIEAVLPDEEEDEERSTFIGDLLNGLFVAGTGLYIAHRVNFLP